MGISLATVPGGEDETVDFARVRDEVLRIGVAYWHVSATGLSVALDVWLPLGNGIFAKGLFKCSGWAESTGWALQSGRSWPLVWGLPDEALPISGWLEGMDIDELARLSRDGGGSNNDEH